MSRREVELALFERMASLTLDPPLPVAWPNSDFTPPDDGKYLEAIHFPNDPGQYAWQAGQSSWQQGIFQVNVHGRENIGTPALQTVVDDVIAHFPPEEIFNYGSMNVIVSGVPSHAQFLADENYIPVRIPYRTLNQE